MNNVYVHGQRDGFLPRTSDDNPIKFVRQSLKSDFEPVILTLPQVLDILDNLDLMRRTMALTDAATALRVSEVLALKWNDLDFTDHFIQVRRAYVDRRFGPPKSRASKAPVPMHPLLAAHLLVWRKETLYPSDDDFVFPSLRLKGKKPPVANMLVADYLRVAARKAGVVAPPRTFGFHTFRRTLASVLVKMKVDVKDCAGASSSPKLAHDSRALRQVNIGGQAESPRNVSGVVVQPQAGREAGNRVGAVADQLLVTSG